MPKILKKIVTLCEKTAFKYNDVKILLKVWEIIVIYGNKISRMNF